MASVHTAHATYYLDLTLVGQNQGGNFSTINIHIYAVADSGWSGFASGIGWSSYANSGSFSFSGSSAEIANYNVNIGHDGNGYLNGTITAHTNATTTSTYGGPVDLSQPISVPRIPKAPGAPGIAVGSFTSRNVPITVTYLGNDGGSSITNIVTQYSKDGGAWSTGMNGGWGTRTYTSLLPGSYVFRAYAVNAVGNSPTAQTAAVKVRSGGKVRVGGAWKDGITRVRVGGVWRDAIVKVRVGGVWKDAQ